MPESARNPHAVELGRLGGSKTSAKKAKASRENGSLGGRPKKTVRRSQEISGEKQGQSKAMGSEPISSKTGESSIQENSARLRKATKSSRSKFQNRDGIAGEDADGSNGDWEGVEHVHPAWLLNARTKGAS